MPPGQLDTGGVFAALLAIIVLALLLQAVVPDLREAADAVEGPTGREVAV